MIGRRVVHGYFGPGVVHYQEPGQGMFVVVFDQPHELLHGPEVMDRLGFPRYEGGRGWWWCPEPQLDLCDEVHRV